MYKPQIILGVVPVKRGFLPMDEAKRQKDAFMRVVRGVKPDIVTIVDIDDLCENGIACETDKVPAITGKRAVRHTLIDTNYWKSFVHARLAVPMGDPGCLSLFAGGVGQDHRLLAEHLTAEYRVKTQGRGRELDEWKLRTPGTDNHWLDCLVGCAVAASMQGAVLFGTDTRDMPRKPRMKLSDIQRRR